MENQKKGFILLTRWMGLVAICIGASAILFFAMIGVGTAKDASWTDNLRDSLRLHQGQNYIVLSLLVFLLGVNLWISYLVFKDPINKSARNDTKSDTKACSCSAGHVFCANYSGASGKISHQANRQTRDHLSAPNMIHCLDDNCTGILGPDRICSDCGKRF